jgi:ferritin-like metal-binding protein YciE
MSELNPLNEWFNLSTENVYARVGKGKAVHLSSAGWVTLCGKSFGKSGEPLTQDEAEALSPCAACFAIMESMGTNTEESTIMATDINADVFAEIESSIERIKTLIAEGNTEGATELEAEVETMISGLKKGQQIVAKRKAYRDALSAAMKPAPSTEIERHNPETIDEVEGLDEIINMGAKAVRDVTENNIKGGRAVAEILLDARRRIILADGMPDLKAQSQAAKDASQAMYDRVTASLPEVGKSELADSIRKEIKSIKRSVQSAMVDVRVEYLRALDSSDPKELEPFGAAITGKGKPSEEIAKHYGIKLQTRAEIENERRQKALQAGEGEGEGDGGVSSDEVKLVASNVKRLVKRFAELDAEELLALRAALAGEVMDALSAALFLPIAVAKADDASDDE